MSRSYKKTPKMGDENKSFVKKWFNRRVRRARVEDDDSGSKGNSYRKENQSWDICDCKEVGMTFEEFYADRIRRWYDHDQHYNEPFPSEAKARKDYKKWSVRK